VDTDTVTVEVNVPALAVAGTLNHHPSGFAAVLPPTMRDPIPVPAVAPKILTGVGEEAAVAMATG
jgi:hypothetical protein